MASYLAFVSAFGNLIGASPLVYLTFSLVLNFANGKNIPSPLPSNRTYIINDTLTVNTAFPPYPPPLLFNYPVPYSNIVLIFSYYSIPTEPVFNQTDVDMIMQTAVRDSVIPFGPEDIIPRTQKVWRSGGYWLDMRPINRNLPFSRGMWTSSLTGINNFVLAYPGLFFHYQVFVEEEGFEKAEFMAFGGLRFRPEPPSIRPHACYQLPRKGENGAESENICSLGNFSETS